MSHPAIVVTGIKEIDRKLKRLEPKVQKKVLRQSMRRGLLPVQLEMKTQAPVLTGLTKSAVQIRALKKKKRNRAAMEVRVGAKEGLIVTPKSGKPAFYPAVIEYGDSEKAPNPFGRRSYEAKKEIAKTVAMNAMLRGVEEEVKNS